MINIPKGTKDVLPSDSRKWQYVEDKLRKVAALYNAREIRTPTFEHTELFVRSIGDETDVVSKEMYTFEDKGGRSITLRPEGTAPVARSYVENALESMSLPLKTYYIISAFRYERPQAGRLREFHQFGSEIYGASSPYLDLDCISFAYDALRALGLKGIKLKLNSIGCASCRKKYTEALRAYFAERLDEMCPTCRERYGRNALRLLDCKVPRCKEIAAGAPVILDYLCDDCRAHHEKLCSLLDCSGIPYEVDGGIVRGLDYYTRTVFEFVTEELGAQGTVLGGGRYDDLVESIGGKPTGCVGFAMGMERAIMLMEKQGVDFGKDGVDVFVISQSPDLVGTCMEIVSDLRHAGISADTEMTGRSMKAQFKYADKQNAAYVVVIGGSETESGQVKVKRLSDGKEVECGINGIAACVKENIQWQNL